MHLQMGHEHGAPGKPYRKLRRFEVHGITLEQALLFENDEWCELFFKSFQDMNNKYHHKMLYLKWDVEKSRLSHNTVSWELIAAGRTGYTSVRGGEAKNYFNKDHHHHHHHHPKVNQEPSHEPSMHGDHSIKTPDLVMISPGEGHDVGLGGRDIGVGRGRCANVTNYMCSPAASWNGPRVTSREEMKALWRLVGQVALARLGRSPRGFYWDGQTDREGDTFPHESVEINTHGGGVPWLHVRVEAYPEYDTYTGAKN